jgi:hypothetical protein
VGKKVQELILPKINKAVWRCPMPFSNMFDPAGVIHEELELLQIDAIVIVAHVEVCENILDV